MPPYLAETVLSVSGTAETGPEQSLQGERVDIMCSLFFLVLTAGKLN